MADQTQSTQQTADAARQKEEDARRAQAQNSAEVAGANAVADAVKRVADAAVEAAGQVKSGPKPELTATGTAGGRFEINGSGFGASGTVLLNGAQLFTNGWSTTRISGRLPADARSGEIVVWVDPQTQRRGYLNL